MSDVYTPSHRHDARCVCEICTCGAHSCPPHQTFQPGTGKSVFKTDYIPFDKQNNPNFRERKQPPPRSYNPEDLKSIYTKDFDPKKVPYNKYHQNQIPATTQLPFAKDSEYKNQYIPFEADTRPVPIPNQTVKSNVPFNNNTTYGNDFKNFDKGMPQMYGPLQSDMGKFPPNYGFPKETTYNQNYISHGFDPNKATLSDYRQPKGPNVPFNADSEYKQSFKNFPGHYDNNMCEVERLPARPRNCSPGKTHLHYQSQNRKWQ